MFSEVFSSLGLGRQRRGPTHKQINRRILWLMNWIGRGVIQLNCFHFWTTQTWLIFEYIPQWAFANCRREGGSMRGLELIMWCQGQWEASEKTAPDGADSHTDTHPDRWTWQLYDQLGPEGPSWWKQNCDLTLTTYEYWHMSKNNQLFLDCSHA